MKQVKARYVVGLTATPTRKDGHHPIIYMQYGPIPFAMSPRQMTETTPFEHKVIPRYTEFRLPPELSDATIHDVYAALVDDRVRNEIIAADLIRAAEAGRSPLLLTHRTEHLKYSASQVLRRPDLGNSQECLHPQRRHGKKQRQSTAEGLAAVPESEQRVILATGSYIGEGFDDARLDTLFLAMPLSWRGTLQQYVGSLHRLHDNKRVVEVYDCVDPCGKGLRAWCDRNGRGRLAAGRVPTDGVRRCGIVWAETGLDTKWTPRVDTMKAAGRQVPRPGLVSFLVSVFGSNRVELEKSRDFGDRPRNRRSRLESAK
jgi:hypothetical protein